jgi:hypothetical protein
MTTPIRVLIVAATLSAAPASAGQLPRMATPPEIGTVSGWTLAPGVAVSQTWDDNVLLAGPGVPATQDRVAVINPRGSLDYVGAHDTFALDYNGSFLVYHTLDALDSYDQQGVVSYRHRLSPHRTFFASGTASASPTTQLPELVGVPFVRVGSFVADAHAGIEMDLTSHVRVTAAARAEQVRFDTGQVVAAALRGGHGIGGDLSFRDRVSRHTTLTADYDGERAAVGANGDIFQTQNVTAGLEQQLTPAVRLFAAGGLSHLDALGAVRTGPSWRAGLARDGRNASLSVTYIRSYVPSYGFGGAMRNEALSGQTSVTLTRRLYVRGVALWGRQDSLTIAVPQLRTFWTQGVAGWVVRPALRIEAFVVAAQQSVASPDAFLTHNQVGLQVIASKPMRIR